MKYIKFSLNLECPTCGYNGFGEHECSEYGEDSLLG